MVYYYTSELVGLQTLGIICLVFKTSKVYSQFVKVWYLEVYSNKYMCKLTCERGILASVISRHLIYIWTFWHFILIDGHIQMKWCSWLEHFTSINDEHKRGLLQHRILKQRVTEQAAVFDKLRVRRCWFNISIITSIQLFFAIYFPAV